MLKYSATRILNKITQNGDVLIYLNINKELHYSIWLNMSNLM
jgi:hypothetical protein